MIIIKTNIDTGDSCVISDRRLIVSFIGKSGKRRAEVFVKLATRPTADIDIELATELSAVEMPWKAFRIGLAMGGKFGE